MVNIFAKVGHQLLCTVNIFAKIGLRVACMVVIRCMDYIKQVQHILAFFQVMVWGEVDLETDPKGACRQNPGQLILKLAP